jgi:hypothetical protein
MPNTQTSLRSLRKLDCFAGHDGSRARGAITHFPKRIQPMSLPPAYQPFAGEEEDRKRKAEIEDMMRWQRENYFSNEPVQQQYRDILDRGEARRNAVEAKREQAERESRGPGQFDIALAGFLEKKRAESANMNAAANPRPQFASLALPSGVDLPNDANDTSWLFDGGEAVARSIFRRNEVFPDTGVGKSDRLPLHAPELPQAPLELPDAAIGKGDRLPISRPELPQSLPAFESRRDGFAAGRADSAAGLPAERQDDPSRAFEVDTPFRLDGNNRVEQLQLRRAETRKLPIKQTLEDQINYAAQKNGVGIEVLSGGQVSEKQSRFKETGIVDRIGIRHDDGDAADVDLYVVENGKRRYLDSKNPDDKKIMESFIRDVVAAGATGIGHGYMNVGGSKTRRLHVGGGEPLAWLDPNNSLTKQLKEKGQDARTSNLPFVWLEVARLEGVAEREKLLKAGAWPNLTAPLQFVRP